MGNPVTWFEIVTKDAVQSKKFYSELFGWSINDENPMHYAMVATGSTSGIQGGLPVGKPDLPIKGVMIYVEVDDPAAALKKAEKLGGKTALPPFSIPNGPTIAVLVDRDGNHVGLVTPPAKQ
jgi:predicted enzyme related to lactoylglutathione lyase